MNYVYHLLIYLSIFSIVALSLNLVIGYSGLLSLAHAAFLAIGSYTCTILMMRIRLGVPARGWYWDCSGSHHQPCGLITRMEIPWRIFRTDISGCPGCSL